MAKMGKNSRGPAGDTAAKTPQPYLTIYSGGQTGADTSGLEAAYALKFPIAGYCPKGRKNEEGTIPAKYPLKETSADDYPTRTRLNVRESDGTLIIHSGRKGRGTALTIRVAAESGKPVFEVSTHNPPPPEEFAAWLQSHNIHKLNVAGPRASGNPGLQESAKEILIGYLRHVRTLHSGAGDTSAGADVTP